MTDSLAAAFSSPHLIDMILVFTLLEAAGLFALRRRAVRFGRRPALGPGAAPAVRTIWLTLLPGIFLMLAIRAALAGVAWPWLPAALAAALVTHLLDLRGRWRGDGSKV